ncbi:4Fe-4S binding protein [Oleisolibacter albus]|uniref:4Fe-4S binding protein n=1 Tax=Oleisolibacter albus TaxID=2171757 RepID=UPI000DF22812|nr:4Fe-4S binding protein [Oleisolibacter albus]
MAPSLSRRALFTRALAPRPAVAAPAPPAEAEVPQLAVVTARCLAENGAYCRTCDEACPEVAIRFHLLLQGRARAAVLAERCTGCGACLPVCPVGAITLSAGSLPASSSPANPGAAA